MWRLSSKVGITNDEKKYERKSDALCRGWRANYWQQEKTLIHTFMTNLFCKGGRPPVANKCSHHVKVSFDDLEEMCHRFFLGEILPEGSDCEVVIYPDCAVLCEKLRKLCAVNRKA